MPKNLLHFLILFFHFWTKEGKCYWEVFHSVSQRMHTHTHTHRLSFPLLTIHFCISRYATAKSLQPCPTLCDPIDSSPPGSPIPGILQARTLEWVAIFFSNAWKWKVKVKLLSRVRLLATPWTAAHQAPPPMGFSRQEHWSGVPLPSPISRYRLWSSPQREKTPHCGEIWWEFGLTMQGF